MRKIGMTSDNHFDINQVAVPRVIKQQAAYLRQHHYTDYLIAGDLFNDFTRSVAYVNQLARQLQGQCRVYFIAGNHDMIRGTNFNQLQSSVNAHYVHQKMIAFPGTDYVLIGNNGWYDYQFANLSGKSAADFARWKRAFWVDGAIVQPVSDIERMALVLKTTKMQLQQAANQGKKVIYMTHFVPQAAYISHAGGRPQWAEMANALMGSPRLGQLLTQYHVQAVLFGHTHLKYPPQQIQGVTYFCAPVGYGTKRHCEWRWGTNFFNEWQACLQTYCIK